LQPATDPGSASFIVHPPPNNDLSQWSTAYLYRFKHSSSTNSNNMTATQRKKTDKNKNTTTTDNDDDEITEQLARAQSAVERNHASMQTLHSQWRTQLLRMAYLVMVVTLHIAQTPSSTCIKDIKVSTGPALRSWVHLL
jgi:hypothetical protein